MALVTHDQLYTEILNGKFHKQTFLSCKHLMKSSLVPPDYPVIHLFYVSMQYIPLIC